MESAVVVAQRKDAAKGGVVGEQSGRCVAAGSAAEEPRRRGKIEIGPVRAERGDVAVDGRVGGDVIAQHIAVHAVRTRVIDLVAHGTVERVARIGKPRLRSRGERPQIGALRLQIGQAAAGERRLAA